MSYGLVLPLGCLLCTFDAILIRGSRPLTYLGSCNSDGTSLPRALPCRSLSIGFDQLNLLARRAYDAHVHILVNARIQ